MKLKKYFIGLLALVALTLGACHKDIDPQNHYNYDNTPKDGTGYISIEFDTDRPTSKTESGQSRYLEGTEEQNYINSALVILSQVNIVTTAPNHQEPRPISENHSKVYYFSRDDSDMPLLDFGIGVGRRVSTKTFRVAHGTYIVYVIANPSDAIKTEFGITAATPDSATLSYNFFEPTYVINDITDQSMMNTYAADNSFLMFNERNDSYQENYMRDFQEKVTVSSLNNFYNPATAQVRVERLATMIAAEVNNTFNLSINEDTRAEASDEHAIKVKGDLLPDELSLTLVDYKLINGAKQANLKQKWMFNYFSSTNYNVLLTPSIEPTTNNYYNHLTDFRTVTKSGGTYTAAKDNYAEVGIAHSPANYTISAPNYPDPIYCMENDPSYIADAVNIYAQQTALRGNTTGVLFRFRHHNSDYDDDPDYVQARDTFFSYDGQYFLIEDVDILIRDYPEIAEKIEGDNWVDKSYAFIDEFVAAYTSTNKEQAISDFRTKYNIKVYTDGYVYYTYYIKDTNYYGPTGELEVAASGFNQTTSAHINKWKNYYSVMRNTVYSLTISSLLRVGTDIPGGWGDPDTEDPDDPVDNDPSYLTVMVGVDKWSYSPYSEILLQ